MRILFALVSLIVVNYGADGSNEVHRRPDGFDHGLQDAVAREAQGADTPRQAGGDGTHREGCWRSQ